MGSPDFFRSLGLRRGGVDFSWSDLARALDAAWDDLGVDFTLEDLCGNASASSDGFELDFEDEDIFEACVGDVDLLLDSPAIQDGM